MSTETTTHDLESDLVVYAARLVRAVRRTQELPAGFRVLSLLDEHGPLGVTALAQVDRSSQPTMSASVSQLAAAGFVAKTRHPDDARCTLITLTPAGAEELARVRRANGRVVAERLRAHTTHTPEDVATAVAVLRDLLAAAPERGTL